MIRQRQISPFVGRHPFCHIFRLVTKSLLPESHREVLFSTPRQLLVPSYINRHLHSRTVTKMREHGRFYCFWTPVREGVNLQQTSKCPPRSSQLYGPGFGVVAGLQKVKSKAESY